MLKEYLTQNLMYTFLNICKYDLKFFILLSVSRDTLTKYVKKNSRVLVGLIAKGRLNEMRKYEEGKYTKEL